jgi:hypothetical protein
MMHGQKTIKLKIILSVSGGHYDYSPLVPKKAYIRHCPEDSNDNIIALTCLQSIA